MLGALAFLVQESFHPLFGGDIGGPAIHHFEEITKVAPTFWYPVLLAIAVAESGRAQIGWQDPFDGGSMFALREEYTPGDIGFDPLGLKPTNAADLEDIQNKELNNGRLAMIALAGFVAQELVNEKPILETLQQYR
jgi:light-harvesting complex I chlorophyll a/b binding protein 1